MNIVEPFVRQALARPQLEAIKTGKRTLTYGELLAAVQAFVVRFTEAGVVPGDRVAVLAGPVSQVSATLALAWVGAVSVEIGTDPSKRAGEVVRLGVNFVFHGSGATALSASDMAHPGFKGVCALPRTIQSAAAVPPVAAVLPAQPWRIASSSGTTGLTKGIVYSHEGSLVNLNLLRTVYPVGEGDRVLIAMASNMAFAVHNWLRCLTVGACAHLSLELKPDDVLARIHAEGIHHALVGPGTAWGIAELASAPGSAFGAPPAALRALSVGGARVSLQVQALLRKHVCPEVFVHYGATETHLVAILDTRTHARFPRSSGRLLPWVEAQAVDEEGRPVDAGTVGRLRIRSPFIALGYVGETEEADRHAFRDGWFYTSDVGSVSRDGIVRVRGRSNDVMNVGGQKVDPSVLEEAIQEDEAITDCAVVDLEDAMGRAVVAALIVSSAESIDTEALIQRCAKIGANMVPRIVLRAAKLPRNEAGKVLRDRVRLAIAKSPDAASVLGQARPAPTDNSKRTLH
jgi:acyl-coenzyme A synthetase/AMP-(fatty) acid ligase